MFYRFKRTLVLTLIVGTSLVSLISALTEKTGSPSRRLSSDECPATDPANPPIQVIESTSTDSSFELRGEIDPRFTSIGITYKSDASSTDDQTEGKLDSDDFLTPGGHLNQKVYVRYGKGTINLNIFGYIPIKGAQTVTVTDTPGVRGGKTTTSHPEVIPCLLQQLKVENNDPRNTEFLLPTRAVQSDDPEIASLAKHLTLGLRTDLEKSTAIYDWIVHHIGYDQDMITGTVPYQTTALETFRRGKSVCEGYAHLNAALHRAVGIPAKYVYGAVLDLGKDESWNSKNSKDARHAWNEVRIKGKWTVEDSTWDAVGPEATFFGSGAIKAVGEQFEKLANRFSFIKKLQGSGSRSGRTYFDPNPEDFAKDHIKLGEKY